VEVPGDQHGQAAAGLAGGTARTPCQPGVGGDALDPRLVPDHDAAGGARAPWEAGPVQVPVLGDPPRPPLGRGADDAAQPDDPGRGRAVPVEGGGEGGPASAAPAPASRPGDRGERALPTGPDASPRPAMSVDVLVHVLRRLLPAAGLALPEGGGLSLGVQGGVPRVDAGVIGDSSSPHVGSAAAARSHTCWASGPASGVAAPWGPQSRRARPRTRAAPLRP